MEMIIFLLFAGWSITSGIVNGSLLDPIRNWTLVKAPFFSKLFTCIRCLGFWIGLLLFGWLTNSGILGPIIPGLDSGSLVNYLIFPFIQSGSGVIIESLIVFLMRNKKIEINNYNKSNNE
jgi:hypothetical protein